MWGHVHVYFLFTLSVPSLLPSGRQMGYWKLSYSMTPNENFYSHCKIGCLLKTIKLAFNLYCRNTVCVKYYFEVYII